MPVPTIGSMLRTSHFRNKHVLEQLLMHHLNISKEEIFKNTDRIIEIDIYEEIEKEYAAFSKEKKPLEYILGFVKFDGHVFFVNQNTLIPRPETENMVESVSKEIDTQENLFQLIDIGTGCGILGITLLSRHMEKINTVLATDISSGALNVAKKNSIAILPPGVRKKITFYKTNLRTDIPNFLIPSISQIIIVANLPYIPDVTFDTEVEANVKEWEPRIAFVGGTDGLDYYRVLIQQIIDYTKKNPTYTVTLYAEMMTWQQTIIRDEFAQDLDIEHMSTFHANISIAKIVL